MARKAFIDADIRNRGARSGEHEGKTQATVLRNNQVVTHGGAGATLVRPQPPEEVTTTDTSAPGNAAANIAAGHRPSPPDPIPLPQDPPTPGPVPSPAPPIEINVPPPPPIETGILGGSNLTELVTEGGSGGDEVVVVMPPPPPPPIETPPPPPLPAESTARITDAAIAAGVDPNSDVVENIIRAVEEEVVIQTPPPPIRTLPPVVEEAIEKAEEVAETPKDEEMIPVQSTVIIPEAKPSVPTALPPKPESVTIVRPKPKNEYIQKPNGFVKKVTKPSEIINLPRPTKQVKPARPGGLAATLVGTGKPKVEAPADDPGAIIPAEIASHAKPSEGTPGPTYKNSPTIVRPDGVTEILGPGGIVLEEIGVNGKIIVDPIKDAGFDIKNPPDSVEALREEFTEHVESGADEAGIPFYVSEETKEKLIDDGLGDVGGAKTAKEQAEKLKKNPGLAQTTGYDILKKDLEDKGLLKPEGEVTGKKGKKKAKEKTTTYNEAQSKLSPRDYLATIEEVIDNNRVRVSLSYNDGVNLYKHKGEDEVSNRFQNFRVNYIKNNIDRYKTYVKIDNQYYLVTNSKLGVDGQQRTLKIKQPLSSDITLGEKFTFVEKRLPNYRERVRLEPFQDVEDDGIFLRLPNFNSVDNPINLQGTNYGTHDSLTSTKDSDKRDIERKLISGSLLNIKPNIDYQKTSTTYESGSQIEADDTGFGNFVHFSSAETRLNNFMKKVELIEGYNANSSSMMNVTGSGSFPAVVTELDRIDNKKQRVINSFDPFEHYMYFESSSYRSGSDGQFHDTSWPKSNSSEPYTLLSSADATSITWYNNMISSASDYDQRNMNSLRNSLPEHVWADTKNNVFLEFMDMVGHQFDETWTYVDNFTDINERVNKVSEGISKDVAREYAKALGLDLYNGNDLLVLPTYLLGKDTDGSDMYESAQEAVTEKIWKRILANLPFFIKTKGTERAIKGLLNCYGIPSTMLRVREYGGPDKGTRVNYEIKRKFTRALDFDSEQYIKTYWTGSDGSTQDGLVPSTVEFRFRTPSSSNQTLVQKDDSWAIALQDNGESDDYGYLKFHFSASGYDQAAYITSSELPLYNDDMWSVMLTKKDTDGNEFSHDNALSQSVYELTVKQYDQTRQKILFQDSASLQSHTSSLATDINNITGSRLNAQWTGSGFVYLGGKGNSAGFGGQFSGSMMEYRLWGEPLSSSIFDNHVRAPKSYNGNKSGSSYDELLFRLPLDDNIDMTGSNAALTASNNAHNKSLYEPITGLITGSMINNFADNSFRNIVDQEKIRVPDVGARRRNATKIRIEDTTLPTDNAGVQVPLLSNKRQERSSDDFAPLDSNQLGIYFSPVDVVNEDVMYSIADFNFDDYIGDPRDQYKPYYSQLHTLRKDYFKRYQNSNNFWDYMRILKFYDNSVFDSIKTLLPARAQADLGILIEPNILERSKQIVGRTSEFDNNYYENANDFDAGVLITRYITGSDYNYFESSGEYTAYDGTINLGTFDTGSSLGFLNQRSLVKLNQIDKRTEFGTLYATSSITQGDTDEIFTETLQPTITGSLLSEHNQEQRYFYSSSYSASIGPTLAYSSSFVKSEFESMAYSSNLYRSFVQGTLLTRDNTIDGKEPVEVIEVAPAVLKTQDSDTAKLKVE